MIHTIPSLRWDAIQAPAIAKHGEHYEGHLPDGSSVQRHSSDRYYREFGIVMVAHSNSSGRILWTATRYGVPIISGRRHDAVLAAAAGLLVSA